MFSNDISGINDGTANHTFSLVSLGADGKAPQSVRKDTGTTGDLPSTLTIKHQDLGSGDDVLVSSLVRLDTMVERASDQKQGTISTYLVQKWPSKLATAAQVTAEKAKLVSFLNASGTDARLQNKEP